MLITPEEWLATIRKEYLSTFVKNGGAAVKFVVPTEDIANDELINGLRKTSEEEGYLFASVDAKSTKIHMIDKLFHQVARQVDWDELSRKFVERLFVQNAFQLPQRREDFSVQNIAALNKWEEMFLRNKTDSWLQAQIFHDFEMSQEFRIAMIRLCLDQLEPSGPTPFLGNAVKEWLRGELRLVSALKKALIFQKIARHNARHMLFSLAHWLRLNGKSGLVLALDISRYLVLRKTDVPDDGFFYRVPALLDAYEVLRQFVDGTDEMEGCLIAVLAPMGFLSDDYDGRGLFRYNALKMRIFDEVRDRRRQNPLASLVRLGNREKD